MSTTHEQPIAASKMDKAALYAIAKTALYEYDEGTDGGGFERPQTSAYIALDFGALSAQHPEKDDTCNGLVEAFSNAFEFALRSGPGSPPTRCASRPLRTSSTSIASRKRRQPHDPLLLLTRSSVGVDLGS